jgi:hypothetical protein
MIRVDLNAGDYAQGRSELSAALRRKLQKAARRLAVELPDDTSSNQFEILIEAVMTKFYEKSVVIIDECDKLLLATIDQSEIHRELREALKGFYGVLKSADEYLRFSSLTGMTKFSHVSIFFRLESIALYFIKSRIRRPLRLDAR